MAESNPISILVVHPLEVMNDLIRFLLESEFNFEVVTVTQLSEAKVKLSERSFSLLIVASKNTDGAGYSFFKELVDAQNLTPFVLIDNSNEPAPVVYKNVMIKSFIRENKLLEELNTTISEMFAIDTKNKPEEWTKVSLNPLVRFEGLPEDIFIQLKTGRMLKLFRQGDNVNAEDVERYQRKGVMNLYLRREAFHWLLKQIDLVIPLIKNSPNALIKVESSTDHVVYDDECPKFDSPIALEEAFLKELHDTSKQVLTQMKKNKELAKMLKMLDVDRNPNSFIKNRIDLVCNISCALCRELSWSSDAMFEKMIYVAHLHDLSLFSHPNIARLQTVAQLESTPGVTAEENNLFLNHPKLAADLVAKDSRAPAEAESIVRQHHERASGKGFPEGLQSARIMPTAALMQISIDFAQFILENPKWNFDNYAARAGMQFRGGPFTKIFKALETLCKGKL